MLKPMSMCGKIQKIYMQNACITCNKCLATTKFGTMAAHDKPIPHVKEFSVIYTEVKENDVIILKFERFRRKALNFKRLYLSSLWMLPFVKSELKNKCLFENVIFEPP